MHIFYSFVSITASKMAEPSAKKLKTGDFVAQLHDQRKDVRFYLIHQSISNQFSCILFCCHRLQNPS